MAIYGHIIISLLFLVHSHSSGCSSKSPSSTKIASQRFPQRWGVVVHPTIGIHTQWVYHAYFSWCYDHPPIWETKPCFDRFTMSHVFIYIYILIHTYIYTHIHIYIYIHI
jgi:hypothetical protein